MPQPLIDEAAEIVLATRPIFDPAKYGVKAAQEPAKDSLYVRIGGAPAVQATVEVFYKKVLEVGGLDCLLALPVCSAVQHAHCTRQFHLAAAHLGIRFVSDLDTRFVP